MAHVPADSLVASEPDMQLEGSTVEVDEMYYGGIARTALGRLLRGDKGRKAIWLEQ